MDLDPFATGVNYLFKSVFAKTTSPILEIKNVTDSRYKFYVDSLVAPLLFKIKSMEAEIASFDTILLRDKQDTVIGFIQAKSAIELIEFDELNYDTATHVNHSEGRTYYDAATRGLILDDDISGKWNISSELAERFYNPTGTQIDDKMVVRITGSYLHTNGYRYATVELAGNSTWDSTLVLGMATTDLPATGFGRVVYIGRINGVSTTGLSGTVYLGNGGNVIDTSPPPPAISVCVGQVPYEHATEGFIYFNPRMPSFDPLPHISADTSRYDETITLTQNVYSYLPISDTDLEESIGFTRIGDSIRCDVAGFITIAFNDSFTGNAQTDVWRQGVYLNGVEINSVSRSTTSTAVGNKTIIATTSIVIDDYISFKMTNESASRDAIINDLGFEIIFLHR
jgi:hypothetical protein